MRLIQLGGATYQANLLAYLHEKNYNLDLICLDPYKDNPGHLFADISIYKSYTTLESYGYSSRDTLISSFGSDNAEYIFLSSHFGSSVADRDIRRSLLTKSSSRKIFSEVIPESSVSWYELLLMLTNFMIQILLQEAIYLLSSQIYLQVVREYLFFDLMKIGLCSKRSLRILLI